MSFVVIIGSQGRMSKILQEIAAEKKIQTKNFSRDPSFRSIQDFNGSVGVIDFSLPDATSELVSLAETAKVPFICGTTGWKSTPERLKVFEKASKTIPVVWDSNFSEGIEVLCQMAEVLAKKTNSEVKIMDVHHIHKKDAPSGTALKIRDRMMSAQPSSKISIESIREGEVFGEHQISIELNGEKVSLSHSALSRRPFAEGAFKALAWAQKQKPGLYSMKDILQ